MPLPVVICDDSALARKQLARMLPGGWDVDITFAVNGQEALEAIRQGKGDLLFLDLNMPVMDGYATLAAIRKEDLSTLTLVVSGDIQPEARERVMALGALDFIRKPIASDTVTDILLRYGIIGNTQPQSEQELTRFDDQVTDLPDLIQEVVNIAMGQAGKLLGELLGTFIHLPVPRVHLQPFHQLPRLITTRLDTAYSGVSQGFSGSGIAGEALVLIDADSLPPLARLLPETAQSDNNSELEILTDLSGLLVGACLRGLAEQLDVQFSLGHPILLGRNSQLQQLLGETQAQQVLAISLDYLLPEKGIECNLLLVFTQDSLPALNERTRYLQ